jgi:hypothetical protein
MEGTYAAKRILQQSPPHHAQMVYTVIVPPNYSTSITKDGQS